MNINVKTIFSRYEDVKGGKKFDPDNEPLSNVEKDMLKIGIQIRKDKDTFKDFNIVLQELAIKWKDLSDVEKSTVTKSLAGTRQRETLLILMDNMKTMEGLQTAMGNSAGSAKKKFDEAFSQSTEAKVNKLRLNMEILWASFIKSETINKTITALTELVGVLSILTTTSKGSGIALIALGTAIVLLIKNFDVLNSGINKAGNILGFLKTGILTGLKSAFTALISPIGLVISALALVTIGVMSYINHQKDLKQKTDSLTQSFRDLTTAMKENNIESIKNSTSDIKKSQEEYQNLIKQRKELQEQLKNAPNPSTKSGKNPITDFDYNNLQIKLQKVNDAIKEQQKVFEGAGITIDATTGSIKELKDAQILLTNNNIAENIKKQAEAEFAHKTEIINLLQEYKNLNEVENQNAVQKQRMSQIAKELEGKVHGLKIAYDEHGNAVISDTSLIGKEIKILQEEGSTVQTLTNVKLTASKLDAEIQNGMTTITYNKAKERIAILQEEAKARLAIVAALADAESINISGDTIEEDKQIALKMATQDRSNKELRGLQDAIDAIDKIYALPAPTIGGGGGFTPPDTDADKEKPYGGYESPTQKAQDEFDEYLKAWQDKLDANSDKISLLGKLDSNEEKSKKSLILRDTIFILESEAVAVKSKIAEIREEMSTIVDNKKNKAKLQELNKFLQDLVKKDRQIEISIVANTADIDDLYNEIKDNLTKTVNDFQSQIIDALKKQYESQKKSNIDSLKKEEDGVIKSYEGRLKVLRDELEALQSTRDEKENNLLKLRQELVEWSRDDSIYATQTKVPELQKLIAQTQKELAIDAKQEEIDQAEEALDAKKTYYEEQRDLIEKHHEKLITEAELYAEAEQLMTSNNQEKILALLKKYAPEYAAIGEKLGKSFKDPFVEEMKKAMDALKQFQDFTNQTTIWVNNAIDDAIARASYPNANIRNINQANPGDVQNSDIVLGGAGNNPLGSNGTIIQGSDRYDTAEQLGQRAGKPSVFVRDNSPDKNILQAQFGNKISFISSDSNQFIGADRYATNAMYLAYLSRFGLSPTDVGNLDRFDTGGYTGNWGSKEGKLGILHEKELVLKSDDTRNLFKAIDITKQISNNIRLFDFNKIIPNMSRPSNQVNAPITNTISITNNTPFEVSNNMDNLNRALKNEIHKLGVGLVDRSLR